jgi:hypothetical protein
MALYESGWNPPGVRKDWERTSMTVDSAARAYGELGNGAAMIEAVAWFDDDGACRAVALDYDNGRRVTIKHLARTSKVTFGRIQ